MCVLVPTGCVGVGGGSVGVLVPTGCVGVGGGSASAK